MFKENRLLEIHKAEFVATSDGFYVADKGGGNRKQVINQAGEVVAAAGRMQSYSILRPEVGTGVVIATEDISSGDVSAPTLVRTTLDYPRNLLYTLVDASGTTLEATFNVTGTDQFGVAVTEAVTVDYNVAAAVAGTQIFATISAITITGVANEATSDTASVGVAIAADVASFGLPDDLLLVADVKSINWVDSGTSKTQNIDSTSIVLARNAFRPEQTVALADDYVVHYIVSRA